MSAEIDVPNDKTHSKTGPLTENLGVGHLDELNVVFGAESLDKLEVLG